MFESDDFDQILSQFEIPEAAGKTLEKPLIKPSPSSLLNKPDLILNNTCKLSSENKTLKPPPLPIDNNLKRDQVISPKHTKRKIINSYFDHKCKRKFPGPAGILNSSLEEPEDKNIAHLELLSQDIDFTQSNLQKHLFESPLWVKLLADLTTWNLCNVDSIKCIKQQAASENLKRRKAQTVTAVVDAVDRSVIDPLIILRDSSGSIKCTLHRDAWSKFSSYIMAPYCALVLWKPTILITGSAFKKHYLNITLCNIYAIYSSVVLKDDEDRKELYEGYDIVYEEDFTVIKTNHLETANADLNNDLNISENNMLDGLESIFSDDIF